MYKIGHGRALLLICCGFRRSISQLIKSVRTRIALAHRTRLVGKHANSCPRYETRRSSASQRDTTQRKLNATQQHVPASPLPSSTSDLRSVTRLGPGPADLTEPYPRGPPSKPNLGLRSRASQLTRPVLWPVQTADFVVAGSLRGHLVRGIVWESAWEPLVERALQRPPPFSISEAVLHCFGARTTCPGRIGSKARPLSASLLLTLDAPQAFLAAPVPLLVPTQHSTHCTAGRPCSPLSRSTPDPEHVVTVTPGQHLD